jgi:hypothetical protein
MNHHKAAGALVAAAVVLAVGLAATEAFAFRMIQNTSVGRTSSGYRVTCDDPNGFAHWNTTSIPWRHNTGGQGSGKATAIQNGMASWNNVSPATYNVTYDGTTSAGFVTDGINTVLWARGNGCNGTCLAITALVLASGQVITETDVSFSSRYTWNTDGSNYDTEAVWAHELGHALGIHHTEITSTPRPTMYASYFGTDGRTLEQDDKDALNCAYNRYPPSAAQFALQPVVPASTGRGASVALAARPRMGGALLRYALAEGAEVKLQVFDVAGRLLSTLVSGYRPAGEHELAWDGSTLTGRAPSGVYFARVRTGNEQASATVILAE